MTGAYALAHCLVDFSCAFLAFRVLLPAGDRVSLLLVYNFCAFALQMPIGLLADRLDRSGALAALGCCLTALAYLPLPAMGAAVLAGVGNALFHVGGGLEVLNGAGRRCAALGLFVSPGAVGLWLGGLWGRGGQLDLLLPPLLCAGAGAALVLLRRRLFSGDGPRCAPFSLPSRKRLLPLAALLLVVVLRSCVGMAVSFPWRDVGLWPVLLVPALAAGKAAGGVLADRLGVQKTALFSLAGAAVCFCLGDRPALGLAAVFLFNMTMPLTLWAAARLLPGAKGFSFGLLTFGLFLGFLPVCLGSGALSLTPRAGATACVLSLALLLPGLREAAS